MGEGGTGEKGRKRRGCAHCFHLRKFKIVIVNLERKITSYSGPQGLLVCPLPMSLPRSQPLH
jgi:hypothetical protein